MDQSGLNIQDDSLAMEVEGSILTENNISFTLTMPSPLPAYLNVHYICETASRLLFLSMHWARAVNVFGLLRLVEKIIYISGAKKYLFFQMVEIEILEC